MKKIDEKIELAKNDSAHLQDIIDYLNKEDDSLTAGNDVQNLDFQLKNIAKL